MSSSDQTHPLELPHPLFTANTYAQVFDTVTGMYLDCADDGEIAESLSAEAGFDVSRQVIGEIRVAAAEAAESQPPEVRRRWIYRFRTLTVNNLVKEYMFMEGHRQFLQAKRELAEEIDVLVNSTPPERLCIAINDAMGRSNVELELIRDLQAYAIRARRLELALRGYAERNGVTPEKAMVSVAGIMANIVIGGLSRTDPRTVQQLAELLNHPAGGVDAGDVEFLLEYHRVGRDNEAADFRTRLFRGADIVLKVPSVLDQVLAGTARHVPNRDLLQLMNVLSSGPLKEARELELIRAYVLRYLKDLETLRSLGGAWDAGRAVNKQEAQTLRTLQGIIEQHLTLLTPAAFLTGRELERFHRRGVTLPELTALLEQLNSLDEVSDVQQCLADWQAERHLDFPVARYMKTRFSRPA